MRITFFAVTSLLLTVPATAEPPVTQKLDSAQAGREQEIERLIAGPVAKQSKPGPEEKKKLAPSEPPIWKSVDALTRLGTAAFPQLIAHFDDERFSYSADNLTASTVYHHSVGDLCYEIVRSQVKRYVAWAGRDPRGSPGFAGSIVPTDKKTAEEWWAANCEKALWELQAENVRRAVAENQKRLAASQDPARQKLCTDAIQANEDLIARLTQTKTPLSTKPFRPYIGR